MVLENTLDDLMQKIWCNELMDVCPWETDSVWLVSVRDFLNHFKASISQIGKPNSHDRYASQHKTPYPLVFLPPLCQTTLRRTKNDIAIGGDYGTSVLSIHLRIYSRVFRQVP